MPEFLMSHALCNHVRFLKYYSNLQENNHNTSSIITAYPRISPCGNEQAPQVCQACFGSRLKLDERRWLCRTDTALFTVQAFELIIIPDSVLPG